MLQDNTAIYACGNISRTLRNAIAVRANGGYLCDGELSVSVMAMKVVVQSSCNIDTGASTYREVCFVNKPPSDAVISKSYQLVSSRLR